MNKKPWVALTLCLDPGERLRPGVPYLYAQRRYAAAVAEAGGVPFFLAPELPAEQALERCDALVLTGGDQLPERFRGGEIPEAGGVGKAEHAERIQFERALIDVALERDLPTLGVCYGMQLLNLHCGGSLRDVASPGEVDHGGSGVVTRHPLRIETTSRLSASVDGSCEVASSHHQALGAVAAPFVPAAWAADGVIEAIESTEHRHLVGVEWHPELDASGAALYGRLVEAAK